MPHNSLFPTQEQLRELLDYDAETGIFKWKVKRRRIQPGTIAGCVGNRQGYVTIKIRNVDYSAHRIAWFYVYGTHVPIIDHINGNRTDNRLSNLRAATPSGNTVNAKKIEGTSSKFKGVSWNASCRKWQAQIKANGTSHYLGLFTTEEAAHAVYLEAATKLFGEFVRRAA